MAIVSSHPSMHGYNPSNPSPRSAMSAQGPKVDESRCFPNPAIPSQPLSFERLTPEQCRATAMRLFHRCSHKQPRNPSSLDSFYSGTLGSKIYLEYRLAQLLERKGDSRGAMDMFNAAWNHATRAYETSPSHRIGRVSLLEGREVGLEVILSCLLFRMGKGSVAMAHADVLIRRLDMACRSLPSSECDVLYGRAGALQAILFLRDELGAPNLASEAALEMARDIIREGRTCGSQHRHLRMPLLWKWHGSLYLGAAHGVVGILSTLLSLSREERQVLNETEGFDSLLKETIQRLDHYCWPSGNLDSSIKDTHSVDRLVQWCHGASGHVMLLLKAADVFGDDAFLLRAREIGNGVLWPRGLLRTGVGLCHGIAGNAYAMLLLGKKDDTFLPKARYFASFALDHLEELELLPDRPYSLYEGLAGLTALLIDLVEPSHASFPLYY